MLMLMKHFDIVMNQLRYLCDNLIWCLVFQLKRVNSLAVQVGETTLHIPIEDMAMMTLVIYYLFTPWIYAAMLQTRQKILKKFGPNKTD